MSNLDRKALINLAFPFAKIVFVKLETKATSSTKDKFERKISGTGAVREGKGCTLSFSNENMDIIKFLKSLENSWCYDDTYGCFIYNAYGFFIDTACGFFIDKCYIWSRSHESRKITRRWNSFVISITFNDESYGKGDTQLENESEGLEKDIIMRIIWIKIFSSTLSVF